MSEFAAGEPLQPRDLPTAPSQLLARASELRRLFTTFGYMVAKLGRHIGTGPRLLGRRHAPVLGERRGSGGGRILDGSLFGSDWGSGNSTLLLAELESLPAAVRRVTFSTGMYIACLAVLILSLGTLALSSFLGGSLRIIGADPTTAALFVIGSVATIGALTFDNAAVGFTGARPGCGEAA